jgi:sortase A
MASFRGREAPPPPGTRARGRRRRLATCLTVAGLVLIGYSVVIVTVGDPVTGLYARWQQHRLAAAFDKQLAAERAAWTAHRTLVAGRLRLARAERARTLAAVRFAAARDRRRLKLGAPMGRILIPRLGVNAIFVNGTRWAEDLSRGPGHYTQTSFPGLGTVTGIAAHRTTFGAWFRHIDTLRPHDVVYVVMPYGRFTYRVVGHRVVSANDWSIIRPRGYPELFLSACHPLFSASHRWVVFARLTSVRTPDGEWLLFRHPAARTLLAARTRISVKAQ